MSFSEPVSVEQFKTVQNNFLDDEALPLPEKIEIVQTNLAAFIVDDDEEKELFKNVSTTPLTEEEKVAINKRDFMREAKRIAQTVGTLKDCFRAVFIVESSFPVTPTHATDFMVLYSAEAKSPKHKNVQVQFIFKGDQCILFKQVTYSPLFDNEWFLAIAQSSLLGNVMRNELSFVNYEPVNQGNIALDLSFIPKDAKKSDSEPVSYTHLTLPTNREV